ncbi:MAG: hypothetical protein ABIY50_13355 [Ignavibacteria bacterium]
MNTNNLLIKRLFYGNFQEYIDRVMSLKNKNNKTDAGMTYGKLLKDNDVLCKPWLLKKIGEIS